MVAKMRENMMVHRWTLIFFFDMDEEHIDVWSVFWKNIVCHVSFVDSFSPKVSPEKLLGF